LRSYNYDMLVAANPEQEFSLETIWHAFCAVRRYGAAESGLGVIATLVQTLDYYPSRKSAKDLRGRFLCNYSPRMGWSRACNHVRSFCQGVADSGESAPSVAAAGFNN
jgi:hypothetical protein